jgi:ADP-ribose pyrophosphatase YjhB (NUDIX family)
MAVRAGINAPRQRHAGDDPSPKPKQALDGQTVSQGAVRGATRYIGTAAPAANCAYASETFGCSSPGGLGSPTEAEAVTLSSDLTSSSDKENNLPSRAACLGLLKALALCPTDARPAGSSPALGPKGEYDKGEAPEDAARREFREEIGVELKDPLCALGEIRQRGGKSVTAFAVEADVDTRNIQSNSFEIEWPPRSGSRQTFPEVDRAEWFDLPSAHQKINPA